MTKIQFQILRVGTLIAYAPAEPESAAALGARGFRTIQMTTVQIIMANRKYATELERLLVRDGQHRVLQLDVPDETESGVVVMDSGSFQELHDTPCHPDQVVLVAGHEEELLTKAWEAGLRSVVYEDEPIQTTLLAVIAAELRLLKSVGLPWAPPAPA